MKKHKAAIFDLDGTLLDTMDFWQNLAPDYLRNKKIIVPDNLTDLLSTLSLDEAIDFFIENFHLNESKENMRNQFNKMLTDYYGNSVQFKSGATALLQQLKNKNIPTVVFSATNEELISSALKYLDAMDLFSCGIISCDKFRYNKSQVEAFTAVGDFLGFAPEEIVVFEDAFYAASSAKKANCTVVAVYDKSETKTAELKSIANFYIQKSFDEFPVDDFF